MAIVPYGARQACSRPESAMGCEVSSAGAFPAPSAIDLKA